MTNRANHSAAAKKKAAPQDPPDTEQVVSDRKLTAKEEETIKQMLIDGFTFEDVEDDFKSRHRKSLPVSVIENYYRTHLDVQKARVARQVETAKALKQALESGKSGYAELAEAVLITGLTGLSRRSATSSMQQAMKLFDQHVNENLKKQTIRLRLQKFELDREVLAARMRAEQIKQELVRTKLSHLEQSVERNGKSKTLGPEVMRQIQEIYGLVTPDGPRKAKHA